MNKRMIQPLVFPFIIALAACGVSTTAATAEPTPEPTATETPAPAGITLTYGDNAQVELVTPQGRHVYLDVWNVSFLGRQPSADDVLLTTHMHADHYFSEFVTLFPGKQLLMETGEIEYPDVKTTAIVSAHLPTDPLVAADATNFLFVIETGGLRIVHFGDIGQEALTDEQLAAIGKVDLAITQFSNSFSMMDAAGRKGFRLMDQVKPRLIIPTHFDGASLEIAAGLWEGYYATSRTVSLAPESLPEKQSLLLMGAEYTVGAYATQYKLREWK